MYRAAPDDWGAPEVAAAFSSCEFTGTFALQIVGCPEFLGDGLLLEILQRDHPEPMIVMHREQRCPQRKSSAVLQVGRFQAEVVLFCDVQSEYQCQAEREAAAHLRQNLSAYGLVRSFSLLGQEKVIHLLTRNIECRAEHRPLLP